MSFFFSFNFSFFIISVSLHSWCKPIKHDFQCEQLTLNVPIATKAVCFSRLLKCLRSLNGKQCGPRSDCSYRSSLFRVHAVCFYTLFVSNVRQLFAADDFSRRHFQMQFFLVALRVNSLNAGLLRMLFLVCENFKKWTFQKFLQWSLSFSIKKFRSWSSPAFWCPRSGPDSWQKISTDNKSHHILHAKIEHIKPPLQFAADDNFKICWVEIEVIKEIKCQK